MRTRIASSALRRRKLIVTLDLYKYIDHFSVIKQDPPNSSNLQRKNKKVILQNLMCRQEIATMVIGRLVAKSTTVVSNVSLFFLLAVLCQALAKAL